MRKLAKSKIVAWAAFVLVFVVMVLSFVIRQPWWTFIDIFFGFMMIFSHLVALYIEKFNVFAARRLDVFAFVFGILMFVTFIGEYIAETFIFK